MIQYLRLCYRFIIEDSMEINGKSKFDMRATSQWIKQKDGYVVCNSAIYHFWNIILLLQCHRAVQSNRNRLLEATSKIPSH